MNAAVNTANVTRPFSEGVIIMKPATHLASILLAAISLAHLFRILLGIQVTVADTLIPLWMSAVAFVVAGGLAIMLWREAQRNG